MCLIIDFSQQQPCSESSTHYHFGNNCNFRQPSGPTFSVGHTQPSRRCFFTVTTGSTLLYFQRKNCLSGILSLPLLNIVALRRLLGHDARTFSDRADFGRITIPSVRRQHETHSTLHKLYWDIKGISISEISRKQMTVFMRRMDKSTDTIPRHLRYTTPYSTSNHRCIQQQWVPRGVKPLCFLRLEHR